MSSCHRCGESTTNAHGFCRNCVDPAPKDEEMERTCKACPRTLLKNEHEVCNMCLSQKKPALASSDATLREVYDRAFYARMQIVNGDYANWNDLVADCHNCALESVRTHAARMAELERVIAERTE